MIIEGKNSVREALKAKTTIEKMIVLKNNTDKALNELIYMAKQNGVKVLYQEKLIMDKQSISGKHQGIICYTTEFNYCSIDDILNKCEEKKENAFILILDEISDPYNLGSIIRSAECAGVHGIIIPKHRSVGVNETVIKISEGATQHMLVSLVTNINDAIRLLKDNFINIVAGEAEGDLIYNKDMKVPLALIIGSEGRGVKRLTKSLADYVVRVDLRGQINSLNASNAASVLMYEVVRQRYYSK